jgi:hypothetical protein
LRKPQVGRGGADIEPLRDGVENFELVEVQSFTSEATPWQPAS